jgi:hypothetical protein
MEEKIDHAVPKLEKEVDQNLILQTLQVLDNIMFILIKTGNLQEQSNLGQNNMTIDSQVRDNMIFLLLSLVFLRIY